MRNTIYFCNPPERLITHLIEFVNEMKKIEKHKKDRNKEEKNQEMKWMREIKIRLKLSIHHQRRSFGLASYQLMGLRETKLH